MDMTHPEFTSVPGVDHGLAGEPYLLPQDVFSALRQRKAAPIELNNGVVGGAGNGSCSVAIPDLLVSGSRLQADCGAVAVYAFDGQPDQLAFWNNLPVLEGVRCVAFVAQEGNQWNLAPGTVAVWFFSGGGKGPAQIINADNPVRIMTDAANSARFSFSNNELTMTTLDSSGALIETQSVAFLPPLPEQFLSQVPQDSYSYDADGLHLALASGQTLDIAADKIADSLKNGAAGTYLALGEAIVNPT